MDLASVAPADVHYSLSVEWPDEKLFSSCPRQRKCDPCQHAIKGLPHPPMVF